MSLIRHAFSFLLIACLFGLLLNPALAEDETTESLQVPWPMRLELSWWDAFSKVELRELQQNIADAKVQLAQITQPPEAQKQAEHIQSLFDQYYQKRGTQLPISSISLPADKAQYTLEEVQQHVSERRKAASELQLMESSLEQQNEDLKQQKAAVVAIAVVYQRTQKASENSLQEGLDWIQKQLNQALLSLNNSVLSQQIKNQQGYLEQLLASEKEQIQRLVVQPRSLFESRKNIDAQQQLITDYQEKIQQLKAKQLSLSSGSDQSRNQILSIGRQILLQEAKLRLAEARSLASQLVLDIVALDNTIGDEERDAARQRLQAAEALLESNQEWVNGSLKRLDEESELLDSIKNVDEKNGVNADIGQSGEPADFVAEAKQALDELSQYSVDLTLLVEIVNSKLSSTARGAEVLVEKADDTIRQSWQQFRAWMEVSLFSINGTPVNSFGLLNFLLIMFVGWMLTRLFRHAVLKVTQHSSKGMQPSSIATLSRIVSVFFLGIALLVGFSSLGIDVTKLALVASALSIGIGFGLQNIINNFVSGIILLFERSMKVGDYIEMDDGTVGEVREINIRSTVITTNNNIDIIVPNSIFVNNSVTNWTMTDGNLRIKLPFTVAYGCDKDLLREVIFEAVLKQPYTLNIIDKHHPQLRLSSFGDNALNFDLVVWIKPGWSKRPGRVKAAYNWVIDDVLREHNFEIPFPQRDIHVFYDGEAKSEPKFTSPMS